MILTDNRLIAWGTLAGALLTAGSMLGAGIVYAVRLGDQTGANRAIVADTATATKAAVEDHELRLRSVEKDIGQIRADARETNTNVSWIKRFLERPAGKDCPQAANEPYPPPRSKVLPQAFWP